MTLLCRPAEKANGIRAYAWTFFSPSQRRFRVSIEYTGVAFDRGALRCSFGRHEIRPELHRFDTSVSALGCVKVDTSAGVLALR